VSMLSLSKLKRKPRYVHFQSDASGKFSSFQLDVFQLKLDALFDSPKNHAKLVVVKSISLVLFLNSSATAQPVVIFGNI
jgi:hypothetical protein